MFLNYKFDLCVRASEEEQKLDTHIMGGKKNKQKKVMQWQARCEKPPDATDFVHRRIIRKKKKKLLNKPVHPNTFGI